MLEDELLDAQALRVAGSVIYGGADADEVRDACGRITDTDLACEKTSVRFTAAEGAGDHCEVGARSLDHDRSFGWLDARLEPSRVAPTRS